MTTIVAVSDIKNKKIVMAADMQSTSGNTKALSADSKIFKCGQYLIGYSGPTRLHDILEMQMPWSDIPIKPDNLKLREHLIKDFVQVLRRIVTDQGFIRKDNGSEEFSGGIIIGHGDEFCEIGSTFAIWSPKDNYTSIGSGFQFALGSLNTSSHLRLTATKRAKLAVSAAIEHDIYSGGQITLLTT